ncbi:uncharacterized protein [Dermacentor andersoni]|uniref:uncharacterized protein n=1 Tax=Dermacentor andersoni TaxID=34620 RepID=UPI003B3A7F48
MGARTLLLLAFLASTVALASCAAQDGDETTRHSVKKRGILESIASGARSLRDGASEFFERSWSGIKAAFTDFMNWLRGVPSPDDVFRPPAPPASEKPYDGEPDTGFGFEHPHHAEPCPDSKAHPTAGPTTQGSTESGTLSKSTGPASTATQAVDEEAETRVSEPSSSAAPPASVVTTTRAPSLQTTAEPAAAETVGPRVAGGDLGAPQITEAAQESTDAPQTTSETTTSETVSVSATRDFAAPTATDKTPVPSIDSTSSPTLPPEEDPFENDIDAEPSSKEPPPSRRRGNGPGFVISDGR